MYPVTIYHIICKSYGSRVMCIIYVTFGDSIYRSAGLIDSCSG